MAATTDEFSFIHQYFTNLNPLFAAQAKDLGLVVGIGDDAAVLELNGTFVLTTDTLVEKVHFFSEITPRLLGSRVLDVNFSDVYAMGALPCFATLSLEIPPAYRDNPTFWAEFSAGLNECLTRHQCALIGGNITHSEGPLAISVTVIGKTVQPKHVWLRSGAQVGDYICLAGEVGTNGLFVDSTYKQTINALPEAERLAFEKMAYTYPAQMRKLVEVLAPLCHCAIDVSDGVYGDCTHILQHSRCCGEIWPHAFALNPWVEQHLEQLWQQKNDFVYQAGTFGGDYNLLFTMSPEAWRLFATERTKQPLLREIPVKRIGRITVKFEGDAKEVAQAAMSEGNSLATARNLLRLKSRDGSYMELPESLSYNHFSSEQ